MCWSHQPAGGELGSVIVRIGGGCGYDMTGLNVYREIDVYWPIATAIRHYITGTDEGLSLAVTQWVTLEVIKEFYAKGRVCRAVQTALNVGVTATAYN